jgi:hypothetical protein
VIAGAGAGRAGTAGGRLAAAAVVAGAALSAQPAAAEPIAVPSGQPVSLLQMFVEPQAGTEEIWARFRYLAPAIAPGDGAVPYRLARADMAHLCDHHALPVLAARGLGADLIVISLSSVPTGFGQTAPEATQYFETFTIAGDRCRLETY